MTPSLARTASGCSQPLAGFATNELSAISPNTAAKSHLSPPDDILHTSLTLSYFKCAFIVIQIINSRALFDSGHSQMDNIHLRYKFHNFIMVADGVNNSLSIECSVKSWERKQIKTHETRLKYSTTKSYDSHNFLTVD